MQTKYIEWFKENAKMIQDDMNEDYFVVEMTDVAQLLGSIDYAQVDFLIAENQRLKQELTQLQEAVADYFKRSTKEI